nr:putative capsid [Marmot picobirnavirus]
MSSKSNYKPRNKSRNNSKRKQSSKQMLDKENQTIDSRVEDRSGCNDVFWYAHNPQLLVDSASFSFNNPLGAKVGWDDYGFSGTFGKVATVPGIMQIDIMLTPGIAKGHADPINIAANNLYSYVRFANSGSRNYDAPDLMLYILAMDSIYACWNWGLRAYGLMKVYSQLNRYYPKTLVEASGFSYDDLSQHLADFRQYLNLTAAKISAFCVPSSLSVLKRHSWMFANAYLDDNTGKAQTYMFIPRAFYKYEETEGMGKLKAVFTKPSGNPYFTFAKFQELLDSMLDVMQWSEDVGIMSGDILKAYGQNNLFTMSAVSEDYTVLPVYNEEVLKQIQNATVYPTLWEVNTTQWDITQNTDGALLFNPVFNNDTRYMGYMLPRIITYPTSEVPPADVMVGTRLSNIMKMIEKGTKICFVDVGTEVCCGARIYQLSLSGSPYTDGNSYHTYLDETLDVFGDMNMMDKDGFEKVLSIQGQLSNFRWHPTTVAGNMTLSTEQDAEPALGSDSKIFAIIGDLTNYALMGRGDLHKLHTTALLSEFNIPTLGSF